jgi:hypothetical protein
MQSARAGRLVLLLVLCGTLGMGTLFLGGALISAHFTQQFLRTSVTTQGKVVGLKPVSSSRHNSLTYAPVFHFDVPGTHFATVVSHISSSPPAFKVGEAVTVRYQPGHPEKAVIDSFGQLWSGDLIFGMAGAISIAIGLLILAAARRVRSQTQAASVAASGITRL